MFSKAILAEIEKSVFKTEEAFIEARDKHITPFEVQPGQVVTLFETDTVDSIREKILYIEGDRRHIWFEGAIENKGSSGRYGLQSKLMNAV